MISSLPLVLAGLLSVSQLPQATFEAKLQTTFAEGGLPGAAVGVIKEGKLIYTKAFGLADVDKKTPFSADMSFEIGSLSKQFTAVSILLLVKERKLSLSDPIGSVLPDLPPKWRAATIEQVLHHMSGIPDYEEIAGYDFYNKERSGQEIVDSAKSKEPAFEPGAKFSYSNTGYYLLSQIVEKRAGQSFADFVEKRLFAPLSMTSSYAANRPAAVRVPTGYHSRTGSRVAQPPIGWTSSLGAGAIVSSLSDLAKWDAALYTEKLLPAALRDRLWRTTKATDGTPVTYGFGWIVGNFRGVPMQEHSGQTNGFTCFYNRFPHERMSVISFTNTYGGGALYSMETAATAHFVKAANYYLLPVPADPEPDRTKKHLAAIRQAVLNEGNLDLLGAGLQNFAKNERFASTRAKLKAPVEATKAFRFLRHRSVTSPLGAAIDEYLYRHSFEGGEMFWTLRLNRDLVSSLNWEDE
jgi:CubicO group peptidase (beta-lactamase class C family)